MANNQIAYGFITQKHLFNQRTLVVGEAIMRESIDKSVAAHTAMIRELIGTVAKFTTKVKWKQKTRTFYQLQTVDEFGRPRVVKQQARYDVALPIEEAATAFGLTDTAQAKMTVEELNDEVVGAQNADLEWMSRHLIATWLTKDPYNVDDEENGTLTITPLANGDAVQYVNRMGQPFSDNHYLAQNNAIDDAHNPFPTIYAELDEHKSNSGDYVAYIASNLVTSVQALSTFHPAQDPDLIYASTRTVLKGQPTNNNNTTYGGSKARFGSRYLGKDESGMHIVEWPSLPDSYIAAHAEGAGAFIEVREEDVPELQGFRTKYDRSDTRLIINEFYRKAGFGVTNREAACAMLIGAGAYANPSLYTAPLPN